MGKASLLSLLHTAGLIPAYYLHLLPVEVDDALRRQRCIEQNLSLFWTPKETAKHMIVLREWKIDRQSYRDLSNEQLRFMHVWVPRRG
jgi:hypothetical protein